MICRKKKQFAPKKDRVKSVRRKVYAKPHESPMYDDREAEIAAAFQARGAKGVKALLGLSTTQTYRLISRFGLIRARDTQRNRQAEMAREQENLEYLKRVWGWDGSDRLVLRKFSECKKGCFFRIGKRCYPLSRTIRRYALPQGAVRQYLLDHGVKLWVIGEKTIQVRKTRGKYCVCVNAD